MILFFTAIIVEWFYLRPVPYLATFFAVVLFVLQYNTLKNLFYTFWMTTVLLLMLVIFKIFHTYFFSHIDNNLYLYGTVLFVMMLQCYIMNSPIYFPMVRWWEYDFRYRHELKIMAVYNEKKMVGRLTDLRRMAGCVVLFDELSVGDTLNLYLENDNLDEKNCYRVEIVSKRQYSIGRGYLYGIRFIFQTRDEKKILKTLFKEWRKESSLKNKMKFTKLKQEGRLS